MSRNEPLTLMAVHAHPDDEAIGTGGILARYSDEGVRTVVVTCTNGELGDSPAGHKPDDDAHDEEATVSLRRAELERSCEILGVDALELLGFHDSGMMGWPQNDAPGSFWTTPVDEAARPLVALIEAYRPQVIVTYDAFGFYGHPDHIQVHRITLAAIAATDIVDKCYFPAVPRSQLAHFAEALAAAGIEMPDPTAESGDPEARFGVEDGLIAARIDCTSVIDRKFDAISAHESQMGDAFFLKLGRERFDEMFSNEFFVRHLDRTGSPTPETDLFAGLR